MNYKVSATVQGKEYSIDFIYSGYGTLYKEAYDALIVCVCQALGVGEDSVKSEIFRTMKYEKIS